MTVVPPPPWQRPRRTVTRQSLSQQAIVTAALGILDREGLDAVSMRRVAQELGTGPASLYVHVSNKDELYALMVDRVIAEIRIPEPDPLRWREQLKELMRDSLRVLTAHPGIARAVMATIPVSPNALVNTEGVLAILRAGGVPDQIAAYAVDLLALYTTALAVESAQRDSRDAAEFGPEMVSRVRGYFASLPVDRFPHIVALAHQLTAGDAAERFEFGLEVILLGLTAYARNPAPDPNPNPEPGAPDPGRVPDPAADPTPLTGTDRGVRRAEA